MLENEVAQRYHDVANRRENLQNAWRTAWGMTARRRAMLAAVPTTGTVATALLPLGGGGHVAAAGLGVLALTMWAGVMNARGKREDPVFAVATGPGNDSAGVVQKARALLDELRRDDTPPSALQKRYDAAVDALQTLVPAVPLAHLELAGYYPDWPTRTDDDGDEYELRLDDDPVEKHWKRTVEAADALANLLGSPGAITQRRVQDAVAALVPPLRAVLRASGVRTHRIEFLAIRAMARSPAPPSDTPQESRLDPPDRSQKDGDRRGADAMGLLDAVRDRLNASATMTAATIDSLATSFRAAEPTLFACDDRTTGELMLERHLPQLERAFVIADDASTGEERDEVRTQFARAIATMRDQLEGIMDRHAAAARDMLRDEARFIDQRHGREPLPLP